MDLGHEKIAAAMPKIQGLRCTVCFATMKIRRSHAARFFAEGWPKCCGYTMHLHTENDPMPAPAPPKDPPAP